MIRINIRKPGLGISAIFLASAVLFAAVLISANYKIFIGLFTGGGGGAGVSGNYKMAGAGIGQGIAGAAASANYKSGAGNVQQAEVLKSIAAVNLSDVYVYPNPYKPNSPGRFQADRITFKKLTGEATIRVYTITGELAATLNKTDSFDDYEWDATNDAGQKLASGVYIYLITNPAGEKAKGKFAIIK